MEVFTKARGRRAFICRGLEDECIARERGVKHARYRKCIAYKRVEQPTAANCGRDLFFFSEETDPARAASRSSRCLFYDPLDGKKNKKIKNKVIKIVRLRKEKTKNRTSAPGEVLTTLRLPAPHTSPPNRDTPRTQATQV